MADESELQAQLRDLAVSWETGHQLAIASAVQTVQDMRRAYNEFAETDPYETGALPEFWDFSVPLDANEASVRVMTETFMLILNRGGLLKIDPAAAS